MNAERGEENGPAPTEVSVHPLIIFVCVTCDHRMFPRRLLCPYCNDADFREHLADRGVLEEATTNRAGIPIGSVRIDQGPVVLARLQDVIAPGARVRLAYEHGVLAKSLSEGSQA